MNTFFLFFFSFLGRGASIILFCLRFQVTVCEKLRYLFFALTMFLIISGMILCYPVYLHSEVFWYFWSIFPIPWYMIPFQCKYVSVDCFIMRVDLPEKTPVETEWFSDYHYSDMEQEQLFRIHHLWTRQSIFNVHNVIVMAVTKNLHCFITSLCLYYQQQLIKFDLLLGLCKCISIYTI